MQAGPTAVAVLVSQDLVALRYALAVAHINSSVRLVLTVFDRTVGEQVSALLPQATVTSIADLAAPSLAGPCLEDHWIAAQSNGVDASVVTSGPDGPVLQNCPVPLPHRWSRLLARCRPRLRPHDAGTLLMLSGLGGVLAILLIDWLWLVLGHHTPALTALLEATRVVATVGPAPAENAGSGYSLFAATAMLATIALTALFTAGTVERLVGSRLLTVIGRRSAPLRTRRRRRPRPSRDTTVRRTAGPRRTGHRCRAQRLGTPPAPCAFAAHPDCRRTRRRPAPTGEPGPAQLWALAAVGSNDLDNLAVAIAANRISPSTRVVMRAGEQEAIAETRSLLPLGVTRDVTRIAALYVVGQLKKDRIDGAIADGTWLYTHQGQDFAVGTVKDRDSCTHRA